MKVALCCIGRLENRYIREYVGFYLGIGIDKIFLYDNNYDGEERFEDVIGDYISQGSVEVINYRNREKCQVAAYQDCYDKHGSEYDWMCFFDIDEFILFEKEKNLKDLLNYDIYQNYDIIHVNWLCYGDNGIVNYEDKPVLERFVKPINPINFRKNYQFPENCHVKSIIKGGLEKVMWNGTPHTPTNNLKCCDSKGNVCDSSSPFLSPMVYKNFCLRHYTTKTIEEYRDLKVKRGYPDGNKDFFKKNDWADEFFKYNEKTLEKLKFLNAEEKNSLDIFICTHKDFKQIYNNEIYKVIDYRNINEKYHGLDDKFWSELSSFFYVSDNMELKDYVGFCHYRRYFGFGDDIPQIDEVFKDCDVIMCKPLKFKHSIFRQYSICHNIEDLDIIGNIVKRKAPEYYKAFESFVDGNILFPCNMFIMKKADFIEYINFIKKIMYEYLDIVGTDIKKRIEDNKEKYLKDFSPNNTVEYQYRIGGYLSERLTNVFIFKKFERVKAYKMIITEQKYK